MTQPSEGASHIMALGVDPGWAKCGIAGVAMRPNGQLVSAGVRLIRTEKNKDKRFQHLRVSMDDERRHHEFYDAICTAIETLKPRVIGVEVYTIRESQDYEKLRDQATKFLRFLGLQGGASKAAMLRTPETFMQAVQSPTMFRSFLSHLEDLTKAVGAFKVARGRGAAAKTYGVYVATMCAAWRYNLPVFGFTPTDLKKFACGRTSASKDDVGRALSQRIEGLQEKVETTIRAKTMHEHVFDASGHGGLALLEYTRWIQDAHLR